MASNGHNFAENMQWGYTSSGLYAPILPIQSPINHNLYRAAQEHTYEQSWKEYLVQMWDVPNMEPQLPLVWGASGRARGSSNTSINTNPHATPAHTTVLPAHLNALANMPGTVFKGDRSIEAYKLCVYLRYALEFAGADRTIARIP